MSKEIGTAYLSIIASTKGMAKDIKGALDESVSDANVAGQNSGGGFLTGLKSTVLKAGAVLGIGAVVGQTISLGMTRAINIENAQKKLEGLGHSSASVSSIMDSALKSVKGTAYGLGDAASTAAMMAAAGVKNGEEMTRTLSTVADVAAISGRSLTDIGTIFGSVAARGKLQGDDMLQLMSSGIPVLQLLGDHLGLTSAEISNMVTKGQIDFATFEAAMNAGMGGAALRTGETFQGAVANMRAALGRLGEAFMSPALDGLKPIIAGATAVLDSFTSAVKPLATELWDRLLPVMESVGTVLKDLAGGTPLSEIFGDTSTLAQVATALSPVKIGFEALKPLLPQLAEAFRQIVTAVEPSLPVLASVAATISGQLTGALAALLPTIIPLVVQLAELAGKLLSNEPLVTALATAFVGWKVIGPAASGLDTVKTGVEGLMAGLKTATPLVRGFADGLDGGFTPLVGAAFKAQQLGTAITSPGEAIKVALAGVKSGATGAGSTIVTFAKSGGTALKGLWSVMAANPLGVVVTAVAALTAGLVWFFTQTETGRELWSSFTSWLSTTWETLKGTAQAVWASITGWFTGAGETIKAAWETVKSFFTNTWASITTTAQSAWAGFTGVLSTAWAAIEPIVTVPVRLWQTVFETTWETIKTLAAAAMLFLSALFTGDFEQLGVITEQLRDKLGEIFTGAWENIKTIFSDALTRVKEFVSTAWENIKTTTVDTWVRVKEATVTKLAEIVEWVRGLPSRAWEALSTLASDLRSRATEGFAEFLTGAKAKWDEITAWVRGLPGNVKDSVGDVTGTLKQKGRDTIQGFIDGVKEMASSVINAVKSVFAGATSAANSQLEIHSPSRVFYRIGDNTMQGAQLAITDKLPDLRSSGLAIAEAMIPETSFTDRLRKLAAFDMPNFEPSFIPPKVAGLAADIYQPATSEAVSGVRIYVENVNNPIAEPLTTTVNNDLQRLAAGVGGLV